MNQPSPKPLPTKTTSSNDETHLQYLQRSPESYHLVSQVHRHDTTREAQQNSHVAMAIESLDPRKPRTRAPNPSAHTHHYHHPKELNSQLAIRPNADQHLRVAPHSRLQQRQRPIAHLPAFLHAHNGSAKRALQAWGPAAEEREIDESKKITTYQLRNLILPVPAKSKSKKSAFPPLRADRKTRLARNQPRKTHVHSLRGFWSSVLKQKSRFDQSQFQVTGHGRGAN